MIPLRNRPVGNNAEMRFWQWAYDSIMELQPKASLGVLTSATTRGVVRRELPNVSNPQRAKQLLQLPPLNINTFYFGYWYDSHASLHLWHTEQVEHDGKQWARFTNPYVTLEASIQARAIYEVSTSSFYLHQPAFYGFDISIFEFLGQAGPRLYPISGLGGFPGLPLCVGQYFEFEIGPAIPRFAFFTGARCATTTGQDGALANPPLTDLIELPDGSRFYSGAPFTGYQGTLPAPQPQPPNYPPDKLISDE